MALLVKKKAKHVVALKGRPSCSSSGASPPGSPGTPLPGPAPRWKPSRSQTAFFHAASSLLYPFLLLIFYARLENSYLPGQGSSSLQSARGVLKKVRSMPFSPNYGRHSLAGVRLRHEQRVLSRVRFWIKRGYSLDQICVSPLDQNKVLSAGLKFFHAGPKSFSSFWPSRRFCFSDSLTF